jgi:transposase-like protein
MKKALKNAGFNPRKIITNGLGSYHKAWKKLFWKCKKALRTAEYIVVKSFRDSVNNNLLERFNGPFCLITHKFK